MEMTQRNNGLFEILPAIYRAAGMAVLIAGPAAAQGPGWSFAVSPYTTRNHGVRRHCMGNC